jgi:tRNA A-37 threonylcarbamoyl transferase component Bud32
VAEAQVRLTNRSPLPRVLFWSAVFALPAVGVFLSWFAFVLTMAVIDGAIAFGPSLVFLTLLVTIAASLVLSIVVFSENSILLSRDGISVPFVLCPSLRYRTELPWDKLQSIRFFGNSDTGKLVLFFDKRRTISLRLGDFPEEEKQKLLVALEVWSGGAERFPELELLRIEMGSAAQLVGCTQLWEDELARRFGATNFVPLEPGQILAHQKIQVVRQLAFGGLSAVYLVHKDNEKFVLKESVVPPDADDQLKAKAEKLFDREAQILSKLKHDSIVQILDHFVENGRDYLLIEYIPGSDLRKYTKEKGIAKLDVVIAWADQICRILGYLHQQSPPILHRDLTPDNLVLREDGTVAAIDFGASNEYVGTATGTMIGKQAYMAPEQIRGKASTKSDVYAFGCTLYFLLTGEDPEPISTSHPSNLRPETPHWLNSLVANCTDLEAEHRPDMADVHKAISRQRELFPAEVGKV